MGPIKPGTKGECKEFLTIDIWMQRLRLMEFVRGSVEIVFTFGQISAKILAVTGFVEMLGGAGVVPLLPLLLPRSLPLPIVGDVSSQLQTIVSLNASPPSLLLLDQSLLRSILKSSSLLLLSRSSLLLLPSPPSPLLLLFLLLPPYRRGEMSPLIEVEAPRGSHC